MEKKIQKLSPIEEFKVELRRDYEKTINNFFRGDQERARKFLSAVVYSAQKNPKLIEECERQSLIQAFMTCAELELYPSDASGEAFVIPYKTKGVMKAQFQLGYQGIITLLYRAGVKSIRCNIVYTADHFEYEEGLEPKLEHKPDPFLSREKRGEPRGVYAVAELEAGGKVFKVMSEDSIQEYRAFSKSAGSDYSPWNSGDPELWMWRKTCIKQLAKLLPKTAQVHKAIDLDNQDSRLSKVKELGAGGSLSMGSFLKKGHEEDEGKIGEEDHSQETPSTDRVIEQGE